MLSVNKILVFLTIGIFSSSLYAVDVSKFDIKGIKLGMSKSEVLKNMPCSSPKVSKSYIGEKISETHMACKSYSQELHVYLDYGNKVYRVTRYKYMDTEPSWQKIKKQIFDYYGNTNNIFTKNPKLWNEEVFDMCYGKGCKSKDKNYYLYDSYGQLLLIYGSIARNGTSTDSRSNIVFILYDSKRADRNNIWQKEHEKLYKKQQKEKASNIDF